MIATERILDLLERWEELRQSGPEPTPEQLCPDDPTLCAELGQRIQRRRRLLALMDVPEVPAAPPGLPVVPGYEVLAELGRGGMGVVYLARHVDLNRRVALKMIVAGEHADAETRVRFQAEARAVARLRHPHIVQIHDVGEHEGRPYLALEFVEGGSLAERLRGTPQSPMEAATLVEQLADAVHHAHQAGIIHRDLKPANVLLAACGLAGSDAKPQAALVPKITDFGLAKDQAAVQKHTQTGALLGTPTYMAPEQAAGSNNLTSAVDVYALGVLLYECLTGRPPFQGVHLADTLDQVRHRDPLPPRRLQPSVPRDLDTICLKCLHKEPTRRYASAHDVAEDLRRFRDGRPIAARPTPVWEHLFKWARRRPAAAALISVSVVAVVALLTVSMVFNAALVQQRDKAERNLALVNMTSGSLARLARSADVQPSAEAIASLREALDVFERLTVEFPNEPDYQEQLGLLYYVLNKQDQSQATFDLALAANQRAVALWEQRLAEKPRDPERRNALARNWHNLGDLYAARGKAEEAEPHIRRALQLRDDLVAEFGDDSRFAVERALSQVLMGRFLYFLRQDEDEALAWSSRAIPVLERDLKASLPQRLSRSRLTDAHGICGMVLQNKERFDEALTHWNAALADATMVGLLRFKYQGNHSYVLARMGQHAEAAREANDMARTPAARGDNLLFPAETLAFAVQAVRLDQSLTSPERDRLAEEYGSRAVALLRQAAEERVFAVAHNLESVRTGAEWAPLRDRADFQAFLASLTPPRP